MAATEVKLQKVKLNEGLTLKAAAALDQTDGAYVDFTGQDTKTVIILSGSGEATIKAGTGIQGVSDMTVTASENGTAIELDSGAFKITTGEHKGKVHITGANTIKVQAILLV